MGAADLRPPVRASLRYVPQSESIGDRPRRKRNSGLTSGGLSSAALPQITGSQSDRIGAVGDSARPVVFCLVFLAWRVLFEVGAIRFSP